VVFVHGVNVRLAGSAIGNVANAPQTADTMLTLFRLRGAACASIVASAILVSACGASDHRSLSPSIQQGAVSAAAASRAPSDSAPARPRGTSTASRTGSTQPPSIAAGNVLRTFRGRGNAAIGSLSERVPVVVEWTSTHAVQLFTDRGFLLVSSQSPRGRIRLAAGRYAGLHIATHGRWRVAVRSSR
jgi:hypothetical protein